MVRRGVLICLLLAMAWASAGGVLAQSTAPVADAGLAADRAKSNALTPEERERAQNLFHQAFDLLQSGDFHAAQLGFERGLAIDPANSTAIFYMAETLARQGDTTRARIFYNRVIALDPNSAEALKAEVALRTLSSASPPVAAAKPDAATARAQSATCNRGCNTAFEACKVRKPVTQEDADEPKITRARRMDECEDDKLLCTKICGDGSSSPAQKVMTLPPAECLAFSKVERVVTMIGPCGHGLDELWIVVKNSHRPGCPAETRFRYKETVGVLESDAKVQFSRPYTAPVSIQTCGEAAREFQPTRQLVALPASP